MQRTGKSRASIVRGLVGTALILGTLAGCGRGPQLMPISGEVMLDGEPLPTGTIEFIPNADTNGPSTGAAIEQGWYSVPREKGGVVGEYRVQITSIQPTGKKIPAGTGAAEGAMVDEVRQVVPRQYNMESTLTATIVKGDNANTDFDLKSK